MKLKLFRNTILLIILLSMIGFTAKPLLNDINFGLDLQGGFEVLYEINTYDGSDVTSDMVKNTYKTIERRINVLGVSEPVIIVEGKDKIRVQLAGVTDPDEARRLLSKAASLTFRDTDDNLLMTSDVLASGKAKITQDGSGKPAVGLTVSDKDEFFSVTKKLSESEDNRMVIWLDYEEGEDSYDKVISEYGFCGSGKNKEGILIAPKCLSAATVSEGFASDVIIQGNFSSDEVSELVELINSGSLPAKIDEISSKTVGAEFGKDSLYNTSVAGFVGISAIIVFMIFIYKFSGLIASAGIIIYSFLTFGVFWLIGGVLTLPGIAALVIGIGMAIDASVISFSRIKDELEQGRRLETAVEYGNKNSFMTIFDSNITTLLVAIVLFIFGESSVKGFATMLIISIAVTMFVMVFLIRILLRLFVNTEFFNEKLYMFIGYKGDKKRGIIPNFKYGKMDFVSKRKIFYIVSSLIILIGMGAVLFTGLKLGIDFKGGSSIAVKSDTVITKDQLSLDSNYLGLEYYSYEVQTDDTYVIKVSDTLDQDKILEIKNYFTNKYKAETEIGVVSNVVKKELTKNAIISVIIASLGIIIYTSIRFSFHYAIGAIIALLHDVLIIVALFSIFKFEISSIFIAAILSIIGYSINDTIVTFDRIRENVLKKHDNKLSKFDDLKDVVNSSLRETLTRSIITTVTTMIPVVSLIMLGSYEIINFNIALFFGLISGVYSSIFIASQIWLDIEKRHLGKAMKKRWYEIDDDEVSEVKIKGINS